MGTQSREKYECESLTKKSLLPPSAWFDEHSHYSKYTSEIPLLKNSLLTRPLHSLREIQQQQQQQSSSGFSNLPQRPSCKC